jgi:3-phosphoshikimate 1-carboxyvinyltransferase
MHGAEISAEDVPATIDELPLLALLACFAEGETVVAGAEELRAKESDRISGVVEGLVGLGGDLEGRPDGFVVRGTGGLRGGRLHARGDHRLAMVGAIAGLASQEGVEVDGFEAVAVSYPRFERDLRALLA